ncbi:MAG: hypothetical protein KC589_05375 [Nanoarchaeota archaeon]|nr:hypothetical protein [Nanoarchaeota archaeon]
MNKIVSVIFLSMFMLFSACNSDPNLKLEVTGIYVDKGTENMKNWECDCYVESVTAQTYGSECKSSLENGSSYRFILMKEEAKKIDKDSNEQLPIGEEYYPNCVKIVSFEKIE